MKLSTAFLLLAPAAAFTPGATFSRQSSSLKMSTTETKVRLKNLNDIFRRPNLVSKIISLFNLIGFPQASCHRQAWCCHWKGLG